MRFTSGLKKYEVPDAEFVILGFGEGRDVSKIKQCRAYLQTPPFFTEILVTAIIYACVQYWYHRLSHEGKGKLGERLWRVYVAHYLPDKG